MNVHIRDLFSSIVVIVFGLVAFFMAGNYGASGAFPRLVSGIMIAAALVMLVRSVFRPPILTITEDDAPSDFRRLTATEAARSAIAIVLTMIYIALLKPIGFFTASAIYIPATAYGLGMRNHLVIWLGTAVYIVFTYFLFLKIFHTPLPAELLLKFF